MNTGYIKLIFFSLQFQYIRSGLYTPMNTECVCMCTHACTHVCVHLPKYFLPSKQLFWPSLPCQCKSFCEALGLLVALSVAVSCTSISQHTLSMPPGFCSYTNTCMHAYTRMCASTQTHTRTHTNKHTHTPPPPPPPPLTKLVFQNKTLS